MITKEMILAQLDKIAIDSEYLIFDNRIVLIINDFEGFDENWNEIERDLVDADAVKEVLKWLKENSYYTEGGDLFCTHHFDDFTVQIDYASNDI